MGDTRGDQPDELRAAGIRKRYKKVEAVRGIDLVVNQGTTALLGRNAAGKSTLVRILVGADRASSGMCTFRIEGRFVPSPEVFRHIGWLPQSFGFPAGMRTVEYVRYAAWLKGLDRRDAETAAEEALVAANVEESAYKRLEQLSGGTLRRVGLAVAIAHRPRFLVLDEPTAGLDPIQRDGFHATIKKLSLTTTVLLATHILEDVAAVADRIEVIDRGKLIWNGTCAEMGALARQGSTGVDALRQGLISLVGPDAE